jgi:CheY-like chemotaxis protein
MPVSCLIVDDSPEFIRAASDLLEREGISVTGVATTGGQAVCACSVLKPDVVLVDVDLGEESGLEIAGQLARQAVPGRPCVILVSAYPLEEFEDMVADSLPVSFLPKGGLSGSAVRSIVVRSQPPSRSSAGLSGIRGRRERREPGDDR